MDQVDFAKTYVQRLRMPCTKWHSICMHCAHINLSHILLLPHCVLLVLIRSVRSVRLHRFFHRNFRSPSRKIASHNLKCTRQNVQRTRRAHAVVEWCVRRRFCQFNKLSLCLCLSLLCIVHGVQSPCRHSYEYSLHSSHSSLNVSRSHTHISHSNVHIFVFAFAIHIFFCTLS